MMMMMMMRTLMIDGIFDADDDIDSANVRPRALCLFHLGAKSFLLVELLFRSFHSPRELCVPASAYFHSLLSSQRFDSQGSVCRATVGGVWHWLPSP